MVFEEGKRDPLVLSTEKYSKMRGGELRKEFLNQQSFDKEKKKNELKEILQIDELPEIREIHQYSSEEGWERMALETTTNKLIPVLHWAPEGKVETYTIVS